MARPLPDSTLTLRKLTFLPASLTFFIILTAVISVFTVVTFLCGSHEGIMKSLRGRGEKRTVRLGGGKKEKMKSSLSNKTLLMAKMISWRKVQDHQELEDDDEEEEGEDGVVWKKTIIKGEKCRPIDFSGKILYDSDGNLLPE